MANPLIYGGTQPNVATAPQAGVNSQSPFVPRSKNTFYMPQQRLQTERYSDIMPFFVMDCVPNDDVRFKENIDLRAYTFASPMMSQVTKHQAYIAVPKSVIYPRLWSKMFVNPKKGDDVIFENVKCAINPKQLQTYLSNVINDIINLGQTFSYKDLACYILALFCVLDSYASSYSLFPYLETPLSAPFLPDGTNFSLDVSALGICKIIASDTDDVDGRLYTYTIDLSIPRNIDHLLQFFSSINPDDVRNISFSGVSGKTPQDLVNFFSDHFSNITIPNSSVDKLINIERVIAYQMACSQFFTSDDVDHIFTAELYYQNLNGIVDALLGEFPTFTYNSMVLQYEPYSAQVINNVIADSSFFRGLYYLMALFRPAKSLQYGDYFNAAKLQPLAIGDYSAPVVSSSIGAVDMTRALLTTKYLNVVNSVRNTIKSYSAAVYGVIPDDAPIEPKFIAHTQHIISQTIVENTADNQGNLNTNLSLHSSEEVFDSHFNQDTIILGLSWYDALSAYVQPLSPFAYKIDRFDDFQPMLQNIGDQPLYLSYLGAGAYGSFEYDSSTVFGYLQNDAEYKQTISMALGGFVVDNTLQSWAFIRNFVNDEISFSSTTCINAQFIRSSYIDFDKFFKALTGTAATYFHFICSYVNEVTAARPMEYISGILTR